ncbi:MAG TPA: ribosome maturation factor RimP [Nocardioidaceae bacterium]|nr:ribosome maturation factor RimP [Nocardioidaceae bacterium]
MTGRPQADALLDVLTEPLESRGLDLEGVEVSAAGRRRLIRVLIDKDGGVTLDEIADATTVVSDQLDSHDVLGDAPYTLEVTSPGVDRPLTLPRHWARNVDRLVKVKPVDGAPYTGRIVSAEADAAQLDVDGAAREVRYDEVASARVEVEFNRRRAPSGESHAEKE